MLCFKSHLFHLFLLANASWIPIASLLFYSLILSGFPYLLPFSLFSLLSFLDSHFLHLCLIQFSLILLVFISFPPLSGSLSFLITHQILITIFLILSGFPSLPPFSIALTRMDYHNFYISLVTHIPSLQPFYSDIFPNVFYLSQVFSISISLNIPPGFPYSFLCFLLLSISLS